MAGKAISGEHGDDSELLARCWLLTGSSPLPMTLARGAEHILRFVNAAFCHLVKSSEEELLGKPFVQALGVGEQFRTQLDTVFHRGTAQIHGGKEQPASHRLYWTYAMWPVLTPGGELLGTMIAVTETTPFILETTAMNEALIVGAVRQHERATAAESREEAGLRERELLARAVTTTGEELDRSKAELRTLAAGLLTAQEEERRSLARELHDHVAQRLAVIEMELSHLRQQPLLAEQHLSAALSLTRSVSSDIRNISRALHPQVLETLGLGTALRSLCEEWESAADIPVHCYCPEPSHPLSLRASTVLYRITQEALRNVKKHAGDARVTVTLVHHEQDVELRIVDDGRGFDPAHVAGGGLGLLNMAERAALIGGRFNVQSSPGRGTTINVTVRSAQQR